MAFWACRSCTAYCKGVTGRMKALEGKVTQLEEQGKTMKTEVTAVSSKVDRLETIVKRTEEKAAGASEATMDQVFQEMRERDQRKQNVILHGVTEHADSTATGKERQKWDANTCGAIFTALELTLSVDSIKFCRRAGGASEGPRPLILGFYTEQDRNLLLRSARRLADTEYSEVTVAQDLTKRQRKEEAELWATAEQRNENLSEEDRQKNLTWSVVGARGEKRLVLQPARQDGQRGYSGARGRGRGAYRGTRATAMAATALGVRGEESTLHQRGKATRGRPRGSDRGNTTPREVLWQPGTDSTGAKQRPTRGDRGGRQGGGDGGQHQEQGGRGREARGEKAPGQWSPRRQPSDMPACKALNILYTNAQSLVRKVDLLACEAADRQPDLILITESWCHPGISDAHLKKMVLN